MWARQADGAPDPRNDTSEFDTHLCGGQLADIARAGRVSCVRWLGRGGAEARWECLAALAFELLRVAYRSDLTAPKRACAMIAADEVLVLAELQLARGVK